MSQKEALNNAIVALDMRNRDVPAVRQLAIDWEYWWNEVRSWVPEGPAMFATLEWYWRRYRDAFAAAPNRDGVPTPEQIEPRFARSINQDLDRRADALEHAARQTQQAATQAAQAAQQAANEAAQAVEKAASDIARKTRPSLVPLGIGLGVAGTVGLLWLARR